MDTHFHLDSLDQKILGILTKNARIPFLEIARECNVSGAAIHQRIQRLIDAKVVDGSQFILSPRGMGYNTCAYIGIQVNLTSISTHEDVFSKIIRVEEIVECHHITGKYSLLIKIYAHDNEHLKRLIVEKIQSILEVTYTETFLSLEEGFSRQLPIK